MTSGEFLLAVLLFTRLLIVWALRISEGQGLSMAIASSGDV